MDKPLPEIVLKVNFEASTLFELGICFRLFVLLYFSNLSAAALPFLLVPLLSNTSSQLSSSSTKRRTSLLAMANTRSG